VVFVDLYLDVFFIIHGPTIVVGDDESFFDNVFVNIFEYERVPYLFGFPIRAVDIKKTIR